MGQANSAEEHKLVSSFEAIRRTLLQEEYADRLKKPLAYWALPNDRRLPLAFLGRSVGDLLSTPFSELTATRGIGQKKISSLVRLLHRATNDAPPAVPYGLKDLADELDQQTSASERQEQPGTIGFDPSIVSEALWVQWCDTIRRFHLGRETLGRLAPSLQALPTVIWQTPLSEYVDLTLSEIRQLKTHGEKRVRVVLEVFYAIHELLANAHGDNHLSTRLVPSFVPPVEDYVAQVKRSARPATRDEFAAFVVEPMLQQTQIDSGDAVAGLARHRMGVGAEQKSVRDQSREMGVTRARVYQLLEDCGKVMEVRWPEGRTLLASIATKVDADAQILFTLTQQLFFPEKEKEDEQASPRRSGVAESTSEASEQPS